MALTSIILVGSLYACKELLSHLGIATGATRVISLLSYSFLLFLFLMWRHPQPKSPELWGIVAARIILGALLGRGGIAMATPSLILLLMGAYMEEFLKITAAETQIHKTDFFSSDIMIFSVLMALGFSIVENLAYISVQIFLGGEGGRGLILGRGIFASGLHFVATGTIALLLFKTYQNSTQTALPKRQKRMRAIGVMGAGILVHIAYNMGVSWGWIRMYALILVGGYFLLTYLLFLSDRLYQTESC